VLTAPSLSRAAYTIARSFRRWLFAAILARRSFGIVSSGQNGRKHDADKMIDNKNEKYTKKSLLTPIVLEALDV
jgi:hypothetical protein